MSTKASLRSYSLIAVTMTMVSACDWVDSTGVQGAEVPSIGITGNTRLSNAQPLAILEQAPVQATLSGEGAALQDWTWTATQTDARNQCAAIDGFDSQLAAVSLLDACTNPGECSTTFKESATDAGTSFEISMPQLRAPVALIYQLSTTDGNGSFISRQQILCALSINEAPQANDDEYLALRTEFRQVEANDPDNLLNNDLDDKDVRNQTLRVLTTPVQSPRYAAQFALASDGSFYYEAAQNIPPGDNGVLEDTFAYAITDGSHVVEATAVIKIVDSNLAPRRFRRIPDLSITTGGNDSQPEAHSFDLSTYFFDPDADPIRFSIDENQLPSSGNVSLSSSGILTSRATSEDVGVWRLTVRATDGLDSNSDTFFLAINQNENQSQQPGNRPPVATDIPNRIVRDNFSFSTRPFFTDPDGDQLSFSATGMPDNVQISISGVISGNSNDDNEGRWLIKITADDGNGGQVSDRFLLSIN